MAENSENSPSKQPRVKVMYFNCLFCPTNSPASQDTQFVVTDDKQNQLIFTFKRLAVVTFFITALTITLIVALIIFQDGKGSNTWKTI